MDELTEQSRRRFLASAAQGAAGRMVGGALPGDGETLEAAADAVNTAPGADQFSDISLMFISKQVYDRNEDMFVMRKESGEFCPFKEYDVRGLPEDHPVRYAYERLKPLREGYWEGTIEEETYDHWKDLITDRFRSRLHSVSGDTADTWEELKEAARDSYPPRPYDRSEQVIDERYHVTFDLARPVDIGEENVFGEQVYLGDAFEATVDGDEAYLQFYHERSAAAAWHPESVLAPDTYRRVKNGLDDASHLTRDQHVLAQIYNAST